MSDNEIHLSKWYNCRTFLLVCTLILH